MYSVKDSHLPRERQRQRTGSPALLNISASAVPCRTCADHTGLENPQEMEVSIAMGVPNNGWFRRENPINPINQHGSGGGTPILGNFQMKVLMVRGGFSIATFDEQSSPKMGPIMSFGCQRDWMKLWLDYTNNIEYGSMNAGYNAPKCQFKAEKIGNWP